MAPQISPLSRALRFSFHNNQCLFRGFHGERVLVDAEGAGSLVLDRSSSRLTVVRDGEPANQFPTVFRDSIFVSSDGPGEFTADVFSEIPAGLESLPRRVFRD